MPAPLPPGKLSFHRAIDPNTGFPVFEIIISPPGKPQDAQEDQDAQEALVWDAPTEAHAVQELCANFDVPLDRLNEFLREDAESREPTELEFAVDAIFRAADWRWTPEDCPSVRRDSHANDGKEHGTIIMAPGEDLGDYLRKTEALTNRPTPGEHPPVPDFRCKMATQPVKRDLGYKSTGKEADGFGYSVRRDGEYWRITVSTSDGRVETDTFPASRDPTGAPDPADVAEAERRLDAIIAKLRQPPDAPGFIAQQMSENETMVDFLERVFGVHKTPGYLNNDPGAQLARGEITREEFLRQTKDGKPEGA
jgi:hypothetical protein